MSKCNGVKGQRVKDNGRTSREAQTHRKGVADEEAGWGANGKARVVLVEGGVKNVALGV